jgi:hypothetical protein
MSSVFATPRFDIINSTEFLIRIGLIYFFFLCGEFGKFLLLNKFSLLHFHQNLFILNIQVLCLKNAPDISLHMSRKVCFRR